MTMEEFYNYGLNNDFLKIIIYFIGVLITFAMIRIFAKRKKTIKLKYLFLSILSPMIISCFIISILIYKKESFKNKTNFPEKTCYTLKDSVFENFQKIINERVHKFKNKNWAKKVENEEIKFLRELISFKGKALMIIFEYSKDEEDILTYNFMNEKYDVNNFPMPDKYENIECNKEIKISQLNLERPQSW